MFTRRTVLKASAGAVALWATRLLPELDMSIERRLLPLSVGPVTVPPPEFANLFPTTYPSWTAVTDPQGSGRVVLRNVNKLGVGSDGHATIGTGRSLEKGSTSYCAFDWLWMNKDEFNPTTWNLVWQLQMVGSPIAAISVDQKTKRWFLKSRNGADAGLNYDLGPLLYGRRAFFVVGVTLADKPGGMVEAWFRHDDWPDVTAAPNARRTGHQTWQGATGHNTMGIYAAHSAGSTKVYTGNFGWFGRATTPQRALELARA